MDYFPPWNFPVERFQLLPSQLLGIDQGLLVTDVADLPRGVGVLDGVLLIARKFGSRVLGGKDLSEIHQPLRVARFPVGSVPTEVLKLDFVSQADIIVVTDQI